MNAALEYSRPVNRQGGTESPNYSLFFLTLQARKHVFSLPLKTFSGQIGKIKKNKSPSCFFRRYLIFQVVIQAVMVELVDTQA